MKKIFAIVTLMAMVFSMAACSPKAGQKNVEGTLSEIFTKIYDNSGAEKPMMISETPLNDDNKAYYLGSDQVTFIEGMASEPMVGSIPHSMVLIRVDGNTNIENTKKLIRENVNPYKWICVGVQEDEVIVDSIGDLIFLVMSVDAEAYHQSFLKLVQ